MLPHAANRKTASMQWFGEVAEWLKAPHSKCASSYTGISHYILVCT
jgi:hypothetical protein